MIEQNQCDTCDGTGYVSITERRKYKECPKCNAHNPLSPPPAQAPKFCPICGFIVTENRDEGIRRNWVESPPPDMKLLMFERMVAARIAEIGAQIARLQVVKQVWADRLSKQKNLHAYDGIFIKG